VTRSVNRRLFLRGAAGAALAAPLLSSLGGSARAQEATAPRRVVIFYTNNGCLTNRWFPKTGPDGVIDAAALEGTTLAGLSSYASKLLFPRGLGMAPKGFNVSVDGVQYFDPHDQGMGSKLTCAPLDPAGDHYALSHSLDHEIARLVNPAGTTQSPLLLSVGFAGTGVKQIVSYSASRTPYPPETNPTTVYTTLTGLFAGGDMTEADYRVARGKSVIDLVTDDLQTFKRLRMSSADQKKIDDWLALLRATEEKVIPAACNAETATQLGLTAESVKAAGGGGRGGFGGASMEAGGDIMLKLIALSMVCDTNRSIVMQWPGFTTFNFAPLNHTIDHHGLSHRVGSAATSGTCVSGVLDRINEIDLWYAGRYAQLVGLLDSISEGDRTLLDNTACMWLPELADGNAHNNNNLPIVIAGSVGGYLKQGVSVNLSTDANLATGNSESACQTEGEEVSAGSGTGSQGGNVPLNKLYVTLLNAVGAKTAEGAPIESFGVSDNGGSGGFGGGSITFTTDGNGKVTDGTIKDPGELSALRANA
jgi:hypothetical protein